MSFDYGSAEAWETSLDTLLPIGVHLCKITDATTGFAGTGNPQIEVRVENNLGAMREWVAITPNTVGKVVQLFDCAGVDRPREGEFNPDTGEITQEAANRLLNREIGVAVHDEDDKKNPGKTRRRVKGFCPPAELKSDIPADTTGLPTVSAGSASRPSSDDDRIPF